MSLRRLWTIAIVVVASSSCGSPRGSSSGSPPAPVPIRPHLLTRSDLSPAEIKYGRAPKRDPSVVYERDVVLVDQGAEAIRSLSPNGLTWTLDANASHVDELSVGKIAYVTGRCVGRVLQATRDGDTLRLVLGPVDLTDIFQSLDVSVAEPVDLEQGVEYAPQQFDGLAVPVEGDDAALPEWSATLGDTPGRSGGSPPPPAFGIIPAAFVRPQGPVSPGIPQSLDLTFHTSPLKSGDGIGAELSHEGAGIRLVAQVQLRVAKPSLDFHLTIQQKRVDAKVILHNVAGLRLAFDGSAGADFSRNVNWYVPVPPPLNEISIPIGTSGLAVTLRQEIWVRTAFGGKSSHFGAGGEYTLNGDIGFTYQDGKWDLVGPKGLTVKQSLMANMNSISIAPVGLIVSHVATLTAGVGSWGFTTGPSLDVGTSLGVAQGSSIGIVRCRGAALTMNIRGGVGWRIPKTLASVVNTFLQLIQRKVEDHGGVHTDWKNLFQQVAQTDSPVCKG
jgi:hypothetical protein